jgi:integrase/recombinase XerD
MSGASLWVLTSGSLAVHMDGFARELAGRGYAKRTTDEHLRLMAHLSRWMASNGIESGDLTTERLDQFLQARRDSGHTHRLSRRALERLLDYLQALELVPVASEPDRSTPVESLLANYHSYLARERGLAPTTIRNYAEAARQFLSERAGKSRNELDDFSSVEVSQFVLRECRCRSVGSARNLIAGLRSLLRFLYLEGRTKTPLAGAVPSLAGWRGSSLPRALNPQHVTRLLDSCQRHTQVGRRDYAILKLLVRLGLRAGEVAAIGLEDIDWRCGEIMVRGKGSRQERLPLPVDVGEALSDYLCGARRSVVECRMLFLSVIAPIGGLTRCGITDVVHHACDRANLPRVGAHRLRHTAATEMLSGGASLPEIAQVLRHGSLLTTAAYAKVDRNALRSLAQPWPGEEG